MRAQRSRRVIEQIVITGDLVLTSPALLGSGEQGQRTDLEIARDAVAGQPLLPGTSLAGALRAYVATHCDVPLVFGGAKGGDQLDQGGQSSLIVEDSLAQDQPTIVRDGVRIDPRTRTVDGNGKFDMELLPAGAIFPLRLELQLHGDSHDTQRLALLTAALDALERGEISIGARRTRGLGRCMVAGWKVQRFDLRQPAGLVAWLRTDPTLPLPEEPQAIAVALATTPAPIVRPRELRIAANFMVESLLIRAPAPVNGLRQPDTVHLTEAGRPIIPGSSLAGALRARADQIVKTIETIGGSQGTQLINAMFGPQHNAHEQNQAKASGLIVDDAHIIDSQPLVQQRISIDRFTGGALDTALFSEQPVLGGTTTLQLRLRMDDCEQKSENGDAMAGLLLLLLKDLWTADLPLGGTSSIGRGRLHGTAATIRLPDSTPCMLTQQSGRLSIDTVQRAEFERLVAALHTYLEAK